VIIPQMPKGVEHAHQQMFKAPGTSE